MSIEISCTSCHKNFNAPDNVVGKKVKCSACGAKFVVPASANAQATSSPQMADGGLDSLADPLSDLLAEELSSPAAPSQPEAAPEASASSALGGLSLKAGKSSKRPRKAAGDSGDFDEQQASDNPAVRFLKKHWLALLVIFTAVIGGPLFAELLGQTEHIYGEVSRRRGAIGTQVFAVAVACFGIWLRSRHCPAGEKNVVNIYAGVVLGGLTLAVLVVMCLWSYYRAFTLPEDLSSYAPQFALKTTIILLVGGTLLGVFSLCCYHFGLFRTWSWLFVSAWLFVPAFRLTVDVGAGVTAPPSKSGTKTARSDGSARSPRAGSTVPRGRPAISDSTPTTNRPTKTSDTPAPWRVKPDPQKVPVENRISRTDKIALRQGREWKAVLISSHLSPFVAVGNNEDSASKRILWDLRTWDPAGQLKGQILFSNYVETTYDGHGKMGIPYTTSADGKILAARARSGGVGLWSFETGEKVGHVRSASGSWLGVTDKFLVAASKSKRSASVFSYDGKILTSFAALERHYMISSAAFALSPGGNYLFAATKRWLWAFRIPSGELAGSITMPAKSRSLTACAGMSISPDGKELSMLFASSEGIRILLYDLRDGELQHDDVLKLYGWKTYQRSGARIQTLPDKSGWFVSQGIFQRGTGEQIWPPNKQPPPHRDIVQVIGLADQNHLLVTANKGNWLTVLPINEDPAEWYASHKELHDETSPRQPEVAVTDPRPRPRPSVSNPRQPDPRIERQPSQPTASEYRDYFRNVVSDFVAAEPDESEARLRWFAPAKRPTIGVRFGVAASLLSEGVQPQVSSREDLGNLTGNIGTGLMASLDDHTAAGDFGRWPDDDKQQFRQAVLLPSGKRADLIEEAKRYDLDAVMILAFSTKKVGQQEDTTLRVRIVDVPTNANLYVSPALSSQRVAAAKRQRQDLAAQFVAAVNQEITRKFVLQPMPELTGTAASRRTDSLVSTSTRDVWRTLPEIRQYHAKKLISDAAAEAAYTSLVDADRARILVLGTTDERRKTLGELVKQ